MVCKFIGGEYRCEVYQWQNTDFKSILSFLYAWLVGTYYGIPRASVCQSVHKACKHDTDWTVPARTFKLGTLTTYDKRTNPIDFQGQGSKVKVTRYTLLLNLVNKIKPFYIANYDVISLLNSPVGHILQRWHCSCYNLRSIKIILPKNGTILLAPTYGRERDMPRTPITGAHNLVNINRRFIFRIPSL